MREEVEKTEPPTPERIREARERGFIPKSTEIVSLLLLIGMVVFLWILGKSILRSMEESMSFFSLPINFLGIAGFIAKILFPIILVAFIFAIIGNIVQTGFQLSPSALEMNPQRLNPAENLTRIFSTRNFVNFGKSFIKIALIGYVVFLILSYEAKKIDEFFGVDVSHILGKSSSLTLKVIMWAVVVLAVVSVLDYAYQRWDWFQSLKMSRSEVKEEMRRYEGDPVVRGRMRRKMFELAKVRMMHEVPKADVIITNPTHIAVALKYERGKMKAPKVVAKGMGFVAEKIIEIGKKNGVFIYEDPPLAWALFKSVEVGDYIPEKLYKAVAKVLSYIILLKQQKTV